MMDITKEGADCEPSASTGADQDIKPLGRDIDEETRVLMEVAYKESLREDMDYCRISLEQIAQAMKEGNLKPDTFAIEPSVLLFPLPYWNEQRQNWDIRVYSHDVQDRSENNSPALYEAMRKVHAFPKEVRPDAKKNIDLNYNDAALLVKGITVFFEEISGVDANAQEGLGVDFKKLAGILDTAPFRSPEAQGFEKRVIDGHELMIDELKLLEFKLRLCSHFRQKTNNGAEVIKLEPHRNQIKLSSVPSLPPPEISLGDYTNAQVAVVLRGLASGERKTKT
jgi:hypothetical protein